MRYLIYRTIKMCTMITSIEIAKLLREQEKKKIKQQSSFDSALQGLGIHLKTKKTTQKS